MFRLVLLSAKELINRIISFHLIHRFRCNYGYNTPVTSLSPVPSASIAPASSMLTTVAPNAQRRSDKIIENILVFWNQVNDPLIYDEMVLSKMAMAAKKYNRSLNIGGHQFTVVDSKEGFSNPSITKSSPLLPCFCKGRER